MLQALPLRLSRFCRQWRLLFGQSSLPRRLCQQSQALWLRAQLLLEFSFRSTLLLPRLTVLLAHWHVLPSFQPRSSRLHFALFQPLQMRLAFCAGLPPLYWPLSAPPRFCRVRLTIPQPSVFFLLLPLPHPQPLAYPLFVVPSRNYCPCITQENKKRPFWCNDFSLPQNGRY